MTPRPNAVVERFFDGTLPKALWTHEAHLTVCHFALSETRVPAVALARLRIAIRSYNEAVGTPNTDESGYHETLTRYYVGAVSAVDATLGAVLNSALCARSAPLSHWSRSLLFSPLARRDWVPPDLSPLPWTPL